MSPETAPQEAYTAIQIAPGKWEVPVFSAELGRPEAILTQAFGFIFSIAFRGKWINKALGSIRYEAPGYVVKQGAFF